MEKKLIILKITNEKIWFNEHESLNIEFTDIPGQHLMFNERHEIYWKVNLEKFNNESKQLNVKVVNYNSSKENFEEQKSKKAVLSIQFGLFDWKQLEKLLISYTKIALESKLYNFNPIIPNEAHIPFDSSETTISNSELKKTPSNDGWQPIGVSMISEKREEEFSIAFDMVTFGDGFVSFKRAFEFNNRIEEIQIRNECIRIEFNHIKEWFSRKLKNKIKVHVIFDLMGSFIQGYAATSKEIASINQEFIEGIKIKRTLAIAKKTRSTDSEQTLFTAKILFDSNNEDSNIFNQTEEEILDLLLEHNEIRNQKELLYLSKEKQDSTEKVRFTTLSRFGFVFFIKGKLTNHFIWELLNSNATYVWSLNEVTTSREKQYKAIEKVIKTISYEGRNAYKREYNKMEKENKLTFHQIDHRNKDSDILGGFKIWQRKLDNLLV